MSCALAPVDDVDLVGAQPPGGACRVEGHVAAADHGHTLAGDCRHECWPSPPPPVDQADLAQEVGAVDDAGLLLARDAQLAAAVRADGQHHGVVAVSFEQVVEREVAAQRLVAADLHAGTLDVLDLGEERLAWAGGTPGCRPSSCRPG